MVVQCNENAGFRAVGLVDFLKQLGEFQTAVALFDAGVDLSCQQVQARQEAQGRQAPLQ